ncbi:MAG TPA: BON domain-containing protein [Gemmatimonadaceae bacterium]|nr:BON domain-containing protein [Gemmatimonadaceae bacterium]
MRFPWQRRAEATLVERVTRALERGGVLVDELTITADGHRITLRGPVPAETVRARAAAITEAVSGVRGVDDRLTIVEPVEEPAERAAILDRDSVYIVQPGDTLHSIALRLFGARRRWRDILRLNERVVSDPAVLQPGLRLRLPRH